MKIPNFKTAYNHRVYAFNIYIYIEEKREKKSRERERDCGRDGRRRKGHKHGSRVTRISRMRISRYSKVMPHVAKT